ncbi:TPA: helix-turn-helix domain-containing protein [Streptococcus suis]|uniref:BglG family transcription antiterminator n=1 Tax=Streptococcus suis TaxID=1307 RepID=UPI001583F7A6|nr:helix-turn-helix domain-containing protein [Streptococcus suis]MCK3889996.1 HTH domain-containing protein [Streptococcus suis]MDW8731814.1 helix-turn-helix domain-containing protein [Streptococcus suis]HEL1702650.1 helix-turn-helix domain-containing protein [Streptococcus suis]HEM4282504.1 helix-turn-helix domain-containing protein [Streptococcus suis]HEM4596533.1 helix-turn-helix domain-containing protein [Streptococcus suis]
MSLELNKKALLYYLSSHASVSYASLEERLNLSKHSLKLLIEGLLYSYDHIFSIQEKGGKLSLHIFDEESFKILVTEDLLLSTDLNSFHKRQAIFFKNLLETDDYISADGIAEVLGISRRSLGRDLNRMKEVLLSYQLDLESKPGVGIKIVGTELNKRLLYLYEVMDYVEHEIELPQELLDTYVDFMKNQRFPLDVERTFLSTLKLTILRKERLLGEESLSWFTIQNKLDLPSIFYDILTYFLGREISRAEKAFLTFPMQIGLLASEIGRPDILAMAEQVLDLTVQEFGISLDIEESALILQRHLIYMLNRSVMKWQFTEISLREQLIQSSFSKVVSQFFVERVMERTGLTISDKEVVLLAAWMELLLARKSKPLIAKVAVITQSGQSFSYLVDNQIRQVFNNEVQLDFLDFANHPPYEELNRTYDLIFTDNLLYSQELFQPFLSLSLVTKENQAEREALERTVLGRKIQMHCQVELARFDENKSYEDNQKALLAQLVAKQVIGQEAADKLQKKEKERPAISEDGYAYPHLTDVSLEQIILVVPVQDSLHLSSQTGLTVQDFVLIFVPSELDEFNQDLLFNIFDNTFRMGKRLHIKERLGIDQRSDVLTL